MMVFPLDEVHLNPTTIRVIRRPKKKNAPELNGSPIELTKNTSSCPKIDKVDGNRSLKINNNTDTDMILANMKPLKEMFLYFLK